MHTTNILNLIRHNFLRLRGERGYAAVETALIMPVFLLILMGVIDFGRLYWTQSTVSSAANEGARMAILADAADADVLATVNEWLDRGGVPQAPVVEISPRAPGQPVSVRVSVSFTFLTLVRAFADILDIDAVTATAVMVHDR